MKSEKKEKKIIVDERENNLDTAQLEMFPVRLRRTIIGFKTGFAAYGNCPSTDGKGKKTFFRVPVTKSTWYLVIAEVKL